MAKERGSSYLPARRASTWQKIKVRRTTECLIAGYTRGKGDRARTFGALHLTHPTEGDALKYLGKVGGGFDDK